MSQFSKAFILSVALSVLSGCSTFQDIQPHSGAAVQFMIVRVETPTRVIARSGMISYVVDLAYFVPNLNKCEHDLPSCEELSRRVVGKKFWVERAYDRYGVPMHTLWPITLIGDTPPIQPVNIDLITDGYRYAKPDSRNLPDGKSRLVASAHEIGLNKLRHTQLIRRMPDWQKRNFDDANMQEVKNVQ